MVSRQVIELINLRLTRLLTVAEAAMAPEQFRAFRKIALDEFGWGGLRKDLDDTGRTGSGRN